MPSSSSEDLLFASSNRHKFEEASAILSPEIGVGFFRCALEEIQDGSIWAISRRKAQDAFERCGRPVIVEDDGLQVGSLGGFPGPYSSYVFDTIGNDGILRLVAGTGDRSASFVAVVTYCDAHQLESFEHTVNGRISDSARGRGWGYDPIFVPEGGNRTFAQRGDKNLLSHRHGSLKKFSAWWLHQRGR